VVHAEKGAGGLTDDEPATLEAAVASTPERRLAMDSPIIKLIIEAQTLPLRLPSKAKGSTIVAAVTRPTIQPKKARGFGVITDSRWASPVAAKASTNAAIA
jgi:hypothetical protein